MVLFINPVSEYIDLVIIDEINETIISSKQIARGKDYDEFPECLIDLIDQESIDTIWCLIGPGAFTRMRIVTLTLNTLTLAKGITVRGCHFFDIIDTPSPILKANDREYIIKNKDSSTSLVSKFDILGGTYNGYGAQNDFTEGKKLIEYIYNVPYIIKVFKGISSTERVSPIYLKDPHITWSKKSISPSFESTNR